MKNRQNSILHKNRKIDSNKKKKKSTKREYRRKNSNFFKYRKIDFTFKINIKLKICP